MPLGFYPDPVRDTAVAQYGPWAVITGASDGTGAEFAKLLASLGINVMLVARRAVPLAELAKEIEAQYRVQTRVLVQDLMALDAGTNILRAAEDLEVGLYVSNAGADGGGSTYLASTSLSARGSLTRSKKSMAPGRSCRSRSRCRPMRKPARR